MRDDRGLLTGTVVSSGIVTLNFPNAGAIATLNVRLDQQVRKGQVLASQYMPNAGSLLAADHATIAADQAKIAELKAAEAADPAAAAGDNAQIAADKAQLALDQAELVTNQAKIATAEIVAPADGIVVAVNGQPGQTVTSSGIRDYATDSHQASASQRPPFSLLPEGPQPVSRHSRKRIRAAGDRAARLGHLAGHRAHPREFGLGDQAGPAGHDQRARGPNLWRASDDRRGAADPGFHVRRNRLPGRRDPHRARGRSAAERHGRRRPA